MSADSDGNLTLLFSEIITGTPPSQKMTCIFKTKELFYRKQKHAFQGFSASLYQQSSFLVFSDVSCKWGSEVKPAAAKGDVSKSVLFDACILAKELMKMKDKKWDLMGEVRVELLSYTAGHCRANDHAQLLSKGGEIVTFVWLLMAHFGIGEPFQINEGHARAKLIVGK